MDRFIANRLLQLRNSFDGAGIDTLMVLIPENRRYLSGFTGEDTGFDESAGALFITGDRLLLATDSRYSLQAEKEASGYGIFTYKKSLIQEISDILGPLRTGRLGFESVRLSHRQHGELKERIASDGLLVELIPTQDLVENLRVVKSEEEIGAIRASLALAESVFLKISSGIAAGMTEKDVAWALEKGMREAGAEAVSFPAIVASGPNSALPHAIPGARRFAPGEPILFDWGARLDGYCSDISRTRIIGKPDTAFETVFRTVQEAQRRAIQAIRAGASSKAVDEIARRHIEESGFKGRFGHGLGHGVGLAIHEAPRLSPLKDTLLKAGMVVTVEPGIYLPDWGGVRLENMAVVREDGAEVLNGIGVSIFDF